MNRSERDEVARHLRMWALAYARHGWPTFPLAPGTKVPALPKRLGGRGCLDATTDPVVVGRMWDRYPLGNVAIATGRAARLAVLDVDPRHGGDMSLAALVAEHGPIPSGPVASTPSGGRHYFLRWRPGVSCSAGTLGAGLDIRSDGGYVGAAPSVTAVGRYTWEVHPRPPLGDWPDWLMPARPEPAPVRKPRAVEAAAGGRLLAGLVRVVAKAPKGRRNCVLYWSACRLGEHAAAGRLALDEGAEALLGAAAEAGLPEAEVDRTLRSALRRVGAVA